MNTDIPANTSEIETISETLGGYEKSIEFQAYQISDAEETHKRDMKQLEKSLDEELKMLDQKLLLVEKQDTFFMAYPNSLVRRFMIKCVGSS